MNRTRRQLIENFDQEVNEKLRISMERGNEYLDRYERLLMKVTQFELNGHAMFPEGQHGFKLLENPFPEIESIPLGSYELPRRSGESHYYRLRHPLAQAILKQACERELPFAEITFSESTCEPRIAALDPYSGRTGELVIIRLTLKSSEQDEDYILVAAIDDDLHAVEQDVAPKLFQLPVLEVRQIDNETPNPLLIDLIDKQSAVVQQRVFLAECAVV